MADDSLQALMDTVETGTFIPDDWIAMFGLLTDELSFRGYGDLVQEIFKPFVEWMESRPCVNVTTPTLAASVEPIEPPPLFLPSPAIPANANSPVKLKRTRSISPSIAEAQSSKRLKLSDGNALPSPDGGCEEVILSLKVIPATPPFVSMKAGSDTVLHVYDDPSLGPAIALTPAVWRVSSSSPLAIQTPHSSSPESPVPPSEPISVPSRTPTPPSERKHRKAVAVYSRSKFTPSKNSGSSTVSVENPVAAGKLESSSKSLISGRSQAMPKTVPEFVPSRTPVSSVKSGSSSKSVISNESVSPNKSVSFSRSALSRKTVASSLSNTSASSSKCSTSSGNLDASSSRSASSRKSANSGKFVPTRRKSGSDLSSVPRTPQPNCLNLQRRLIIISPPPRPGKSTHQN
ncbi:hypothetical protein H2248_010802 [Termitomyces sp. 'cryptogamus']|nr:hypothetical protein H2248_010802 [Termitomyces sp. 'cryptogamus']